MAGANILRAHNVRPYEEIMKALGRGKTTIYESGVGTGKSFVFMAVASNIKGKILYVIPKHVIVNNVNSYMEFAAIKEKVDFITFNAFTDCEKSKKLIEGYELVIIDECHHLGSEKYGTCLVDLIKNHSSYTKILGLTATPIRDDGIDVREYFDTCVYGLSNFEAISQGLMPSIEYRLCLPDKDLKQIEKEYEGSIKAVLSFEESEDVLTSAIKAFPRDKWICFFPSVKEIHKCEALVRRMFPEYEVLILYSELGNLDEVIDKLKTAKKAVVLSCNILLEGVHLPGIDGIVLFRNVTSLTAFQQMIGRICSIGKEIEPVVLDCSTCAIKLMAKLMSIKQTGVEKKKMTDITPMKEIVHIGIGEHRHYDLNRLLLAVNPKLAKQKAKEKNAKLAIEKYMSFHGKMYSSISELMSSDLDMKKLKACCRLYDVSFDFTAGLMAAM